MTHTEVSDQQITYLSWAEYVNTFPFTSSNSTKPGHLRDSDSKRAKPASGLPLLMYLRMTQNLSIEQNSNLDIQLELVTAFLLVIGQLEQVWSLSFSFDSGEQGFKQFKVDPGCCSRAVSIAVVADWIANMQRLPALCWFQKALWTERLGLWANTFGTVISRKKKKKKKKKKKIYMVY